MTGTPLLLIHGSAYLPRPIRASMQRSAIFGLFLIISTAINAQVQHGGVAPGLSGSALQLEAPPLHTLQPLEVAVLEQEDTERIASGIAAPYRFAETYTVDLGLEVGAWSELSSGERVWRLAVECREAKSMGFLFDRFVLPEGARVYITNEHGEQRGAFLRPTNGATVLGIDQLAGEHLTIEYVEPAGTLELVDLHVSTVYAAYRGNHATDRDFGESMDCNVNVICPEGDAWRDQIRSVALVNTGAGYCSGTLLNNCLGDGTPYFLTANHCLVTPVSGWTFIWNWDSPTCDPTENAPQNMSISGSEMLATEVLTDFALLRLFQTPPEAYNVYYSGWDATGAPAEEVVGIHHPSGDIKKISRSFDEVEATQQVVGADLREVWAIEFWSDGIVEVGSSGSGLWNPDRLLIGQLSGGLGTCDNDDGVAAYGRFHLAFPLMEQWLGDCGLTLPGIDESEVVVPIFEDAAVTSITNIGELLCGVDSVSPVITLKNNGINDLTSVVIEYAINGDVPYTQAWSGNLVTGQTANVALAAIPTPSGANQLVIGTTLPNNTVDQVPENDAWAYGFTASIPAAAISLILTLDDFGSDVTWTLTSSANTILYNGGPYPDGNEGLVDSVAFCLTNDCYTFTILDEFGNGLCCDDGEGSYVIRDLFGGVYAESDGQFDDINSDEFCLEAVHVAEVERPRFRVQPNPNDGAFAIMDLDGRSIEMVRILDVLGRQVFSISGNNNAQVHIDLRLPAGAYFVVLSGSDGSAVQRMIVAR